MTIGPMAQAVLPAAASAPRASRVAAAGVVRGGQAGQDARWEGLLQANRISPEMKRDPGFLAYLCRQLEAAAVNSLLQTARRTVPTGGPLSGGFAGEIYQGMADEEYSRLIAAGGGFGVGDAIFRQVCPAGAAARTAPAAHVPVRTDFGYALKRPVSAGELSRSPGGVR